MHTKFFVGELEGKRPVGSHGADKMMILNWILEETS
jgi:hypothetical protein